MKTKTILFVIVVFFTVSSLIMAQTTVTFSKPAEEGEFTIFAYSPEKVVIIDSAARVGYAFDTAKKEKVGSFTSKVAEPRAATWAGKDFWILDQKTEKIYQVDPENGNTIKGIPAPKPEGKGKWSYEGLTWDGQNLWVAYFAGFSSKILQIDPQEGKIVQSFFADANLRGIYSDGKYLWGLCYNGKFPSVIDRRTIAKGGFATGKTREFLGKVDVPNPRGLAFDGKSFLTLNVKKGEVVSFSPKKK
jgi:DNA-binding beta-propeller fold protein YncE